MRILKIIFYEVRWKISPFRNSHPIFEFFSLKNYWTNVLLFNFKPYYNIIMTL